MTRVLYNEGDQTVVHVPRDVLYRAVAASGTCEVLDLRESETSATRVVVAAAAATQDPTSATLAQAAGPATGAALEICLPTTAGFRVGHTYRIEDPDGDGEEIVVSAIDTSGAQRLHLLTPLQRDYASASTLSGVELSCTVPLSLLDDEDNLGNEAGPYAVVWRYTIDSTDYVIPAQFFVERYSVRPPASEVDVLLSRSTLADRCRGRIRIFPKLVDATHDFVADLEAMDIHPARTLLTSAAKRAVVRLALESIYRELGTEDDIREAEYWAMRYSKVLGQIGSGKKPIGSVTVDNDPGIAPAGSDKKRRGFLASS